jgi:hypothetical protein
MHRRFTPRLTTLESRIALAGDVTMGDSQPPSPPEVFAPTIEDAYIHWLDTMDDMPNGEDAFAPADGPIPNDDGTVAIPVGGPTDPF